MNLPPPNSSSFPYTTPFRSLHERRIFKSHDAGEGNHVSQTDHLLRLFKRTAETVKNAAQFARVVFQNRQRVVRSEEHTSELQSQSNLVCSLLLEKIKIHSITLIHHFFF